MSVRSPVIRLTPPPWAVVVELACRVGYVARGFVYFSVGLIALMAAFRLTPHAEGAQGALIAAWAYWPMGDMLIWLTALGLIGFAGWRALQALGDADRLGRSPRALAKRAGMALSGLVYGGLALSLLELLDTFRDVRHADDRAGTRELVGTVLAWPGGPALVIAAGGFILALGVGNMAQGLFRDFSKGLTSDGAIDRWAVRLGRAGYFARGVAFLPAGALMIAAGWHARAAEAGGVGGALDALKHQPFGHPLLGLIGLGLIAFGLFAFAEARFRDICTTGTFPD